MCMLSISVKKENLIKFGKMRTPNTIVDCWLYQPPLVDVENSINYAALAITKRVSFFLVNFFFNSLKSTQCTMVGGDYHFQGSKYDKTSCSHAHTQTS